MNIQKYKVDQKTKLDLKCFDPSESAPISEREKILSETAKLTEVIAKLQEKLFASKRHALLVVIQGMDGSGKDSTIKHTLTGINPQGVQVTSFKVPTELEQHHDPLWRVHAAIPPRGTIGIFNRSHYEDVLITRVHGQIDKSEVKKRLKHIRNFEAMLADSDVVVRKIYLNISKDAQKNQLQQRIGNPEKRWKFSLSDLSERELWPSYQSAYEDAIGETGTPDAPWYIVPSNTRWYRNWVVLNIISEALSSLNLKYPAADPNIDWQSLQVK